MKGYVEHMRNSTKKLTNPGSIFVKDHPDYDLIVDKQKDSIDFCLQKEDDDYKFAYLDLNSGSMFSRTKKSDFKPQGWDFYTKYMNDYVEKWDKIKGN